MWELQNKKSSAKKNNLHDNHFQNLLNWSSYVSPDGEVVKWNQKDPEAVVIVTLWRISMWKYTCPKHVLTMQVKKKPSIDCLQRRIVNFCVFTLLFKQNHRFLLNKKNINMQHGFASGLNYKQCFLQLYLELLTFQIPVNSIMLLNIKSGLGKRHAGKEWNFMGQSKQQTV